MPSTKVFGQTIAKDITRERSNTGSSKYQRQFGGQNNRRGDLSVFTSEPGPPAAQATAVARLRGEALDESFGIERFSINHSVPYHGAEKKALQRRGWLFNVLSTTIVSSAEEGDVGGERSGVDLFFLEESGRRFKSTILYRPYFYVLPELMEESCETNDAEILRELIVSSLYRVIENAYHVEIVLKIDLDQPNHLSPQYQDGRPVVKLSFDSIRQLTIAKEQVMQLIMKRNSRARVFNMDIDLQSIDPLERLEDIREYDIPYVVRVCIDENVRVGTWYTVELVDETEDDKGLYLLDPDIELKANPVFLAFDIECTKASLKFPNAENDEIFMISYMVSSSSGGTPQGYLIVSRSVVSSDISNFEYTPKHTYPGPFIIFNESNECALLNRFFDEYRRISPQIVVTYNGDFFDWPFVEARAKIYGLNLYNYLGIRREGGENGDYRGRCSVHLDAFHWVQRDSYLPQGSQGLKAVTKYKLGYDPVEVDPEDMVRFALEKPFHMATYSVSDAVATFYLYEKYVHLFIFSLCTIIPMGPEDVLRKGSGTLCEALLMVQACSKSIVCPNKEIEAAAKFHRGHLIESETYIGGKVECLETGVYRSDLEYNFDLKACAFDELIHNLDRDLTFAIEVEGGLDRKDVINYDQIKCEITDSLEMLRDYPSRLEKPYVYHLDVGAMYPNIILSNRLQPSAMIDDSVCATCSYNSSKNNCKRSMEWTWRGDYSPATRSEYDRIKDQLSREVPCDGFMFNQLTEKEKTTMVATRLKEYSRMAYKKGKVTSEETRNDIVCMRENSFYVDTVRQFRDRRYEYKKLNKNWKDKAFRAQDAAEKKQAEDKTLIYDSLQVAHKCILNSFYGYVMRKGARWRSMEMAGIVTRNGAQIILQARQLVEQIGRPLELDTDGIWCILPCSFPDVYTFETKGGSKLKLEYPCVMLNAACHDKFTNHQYQTLVDSEKGKFSTRSECSIFFEVDGPYRCMFLPASTEEGKLLKKRYAVFNHDKSLAELKGFELKRRGELELIKTFQSQVFSRFLDGTTLHECYESAAKVANHWIDIIDTHGESLEDDELIGLISENRSMSRQLDDYGDQKGTSQTTARRLGEFLGNEIIKDKGLNCKFVIAEQPYGSPVTARAIPTAIWKAEPAVKKHFLRKWLKSPGIDGEALDIRNIIDWDYYMDRLGKTIQKIITIPAALQKVPNPVPRVPHPIWLEMKVSQMNDRFQQKNIQSMFPFHVPITDSSNSDIVDIEDVGQSLKFKKRPVVHKLSLKSRANPAASVSESTTELHTPQLNVRIKLSKDNFSDWLQQKKLNWRKRRKQRKSLTVTPFSNEQGTRDKKSRNCISVEGFVREAEFSRFQREWHIVEVRPCIGYDSVGNAQLALSSSDMIMWVMIGGTSLQKIKLSVPRIIFITTKKEIINDCESIMEFMRVDKHLPRNKSASFLYRVTIPEHVFRTQQWTSGLKAIDGSSGGEIGLEAMYESETTLLTRAIASLGAISRLADGIPTKLKTSLTLTELENVQCPTEGEYLHPRMSYKRVFLYVRINHSSKTGIVALFSLGKNDEHAEQTDITRPSRCGSFKFDVGATCHMWIIKPGAKTGQRNVSLKQCDTLFTQLLDSIQSATDLDSEYTCVSPASDVKVLTLNFLESDKLALAGANDVISIFQKGTGPVFLLLMSNKPASELRRHMSTFASSPVLIIPFPPGEAHNPWQSTLPALNWEQPAVQLSFESYLFTIVVAYPKRVAYSRYGNIPVGNLGDDENSAVYEISLSRLILKNRAILWASVSSGQPDLGVAFLPTYGGGFFPAVTKSSYMCDEEEIWGNDENDFVSPVLRKPGCYRKVCVDIDVHDLAIAALTVLPPSFPTITNSSGRSCGDAASPTSATGANVVVIKHSEPIGDEMSTAVSLPILRTLVGGWLRDAIATNSLVADELLHHVYRLISSPDSILYDASLHRIVHSFMKSTFLRLLGELQRLGCSIIFASFHRITVATSKMYLHEAQEYIDFVISTVLKRSVTLSGCDGEDGIARVSLRPRQFHSHYVFLDEYNFGTIQLTKIAKDNLKEDSDFVLPFDNDMEFVVIPTVVTAWSLMNYLGSSVAQEYFRAIIGRFSSDIFRKQMDLTLAKGGIEMSVEANQLLIYKKHTISERFAAYLTRALDDILKNDEEDQIPPPLLGDKTYQTLVPAVEFVKNVNVVLRLDSEMELEVHALTRSLFAQLGIAEYASVAQWKNPCPRYILPDVFCKECQESRDVNLCHVPPREFDEDFERVWICEDCGMPFDASVIEKRLIGVLNRKLSRYQLQDVRCARTNRVVTRALRPTAETTAGIKLDENPSEAEEEVRLLQNLAIFHDLESLESITTGILSGFS